MKKLSILFIVLSVFFIVSCKQNAENPEEVENKQTHASGTLYSITVTAATNGKIIPNKTSEIRAGEEIYLIVEPDEDYELKSLIVSTTEKKDLAVAAVSKGILYKFTMPIGNVIINSEFAKESISDWFSTEGYVKQTTQSNSEFIAGNPPKDIPGAVRYEHKYQEALNCIFKVKKLTTDPANDIIDELIEDTSLTQRFTITSTPNDSIQGFIFYCDSENVYVVNNLYKYNYVDYSRLYTSPQFCFEISIDGIQKLVIYMNYRSNLSNPFN